MTFEEAYELDRNEELTAAIDAYEKLLTGDPCCKRTHLNLLYAYGELWDEGTGWGEGLTRREISPYWDKTEPAFERAFESTNRDADIVAAALHIRSYFMHSQRRDDVVGEMRKLIRTPGALEPFLFMHRWDACGERTGEFEDGARRLVRSVEGDESQRGQYIRSMLADVRPG